MNHDLLLIRFLADELSQTERKTVTDKLITDQNLQQRLSELREFWETDGEKPGEQSHQSEDWMKLSNSLSNKNDSKIKLPYNHVITKWIVRVAAVVLIIIGTTLIWESQQSLETIHGRTIEPVASILPDGSKIYLSKGSRLKYPKTFKSENRTVELTGEGYFDVVSNPKKPFIVNTGETKVLVTGTSFTVKAPGKSEEVAVLVRAGKVLFYNSDIPSANSFKVGLGPGDIGTYFPGIKQLNKTHNKDYKNLNWN
ncbi:MAG: FecR domain-containing protein [Bacteroidales bacterium]|nr:FecR domain-containing protein [Bacteroidales bacterium]